MPRLPAPQLGRQFDDNFGKYFVAQVSNGPALHDGAVILSRRFMNEKYKLTGWSYRLLSPHHVSAPEMNRGSAYNSAISMSLVDKVDLMALVFASNVEAYVEGRKVEIIK